MFVCVYGPLYVFNGCCDDDVTLGDRLVAYGVVNNGRAGIGARGAGPWCQFGAHVVAMSV